MWWGVSGGGEQQHLAQIDLTNCYWSVGVAVTYRNRELSSLRACELWVFATWPRIAGIHCITCWSRPCFHEVS